MAIFDKQWWIETLQLNEITDNEVESNIVTGFKLYPFKQGFGRAYKTLNGKASKELSDSINVWINKKFPESHVRVAYESIYATINIINPNVLHESILHESPPIEFETDDYENYVNQNRGLIEKTAAEFNFPIQDMLYAFTAGSEVVLSDDMWSKLENSKSYKVKSLDEAIQIALKAGFDPKPYIDFIKEGKELPLPMVLCYGQDKHYLVGGDVILSLYKALGSIPTVLQGTLNMQTKTLHEPLEEDIESSIKNKHADIVKYFIKFAVKELDLKQLPSGITLSYNTEQAKDTRSFGTFNPENDHIWLYVKDRNTADFLRTLAHELVHRKQAEDGRLEPGDGATGSNIENEANAQAGILLRNFGKDHKEIYETLSEGVYGDHLFGDKESGVSIGWYKDEIEKDTPAELALFKLLKKYADSEKETYSNINLDNLVPIFKKLKKQYPEIVESKISPDTYIYRGTAMPEERLMGLEADAETEAYNQGIILLDQKYSSRRKVQSWSTSYFPAAGFAVTTAKEKGGVPVIMRAKAGDAELFFTPAFMEKLSTQLEDETFNITNPIPVDIMVIENYEDEFEDIESGYLHDKGIDENFGKNWWKKQLKEAIQFNNWVVPSTSQLKQEFRIEHEMKGNDFFESEDEFLQAVENGKIITVTPAIDAQIGYRSGTTSREELLDLIKSYRSYPKYRNEDTIQSLYNAFETNQSIDLPVIIEFTDGTKRIFSGNTRMDIAFQLGINPKALLIKSNI
jgi:hypothetical protein